MDAIYCPQCGRTATADDAYCGECGFHIAVSRPTSRLEALPVRVGYRGRWALVALSVLFASAAVTVGVLATGDSSGTQRAIGTTAPSTTSPPATSPPTTTTMEIAAIDSFGDDAALDAMWTACADGDLESCDMLWLTAPPDSAYEAYGYSCGDRGSANGRCVAVAAAEASDGLVWAENGSFGMPIPAGWDTVEEVFSGDDTVWDKAVVVFASPSIDAFVDDRAGSWEFTTVGVAVWVVQGASVDFLPDLDRPADCVYLGDVSSIDTPGGLTGYGDLYDCPGGLIWAAYILTHPDHEGVGVVIEGVYRTPEEEATILDTLTGVRLP